MMRPSARALLRASSRTAGQVVPRTTRTQLSRISRRYASNVPADKPHSWKSRFLRLGLAGAAIYYYNTSTLFADQPGFDPKAPPQTSLGDEPFQTLDSIASKKRERTAAEAKAAAARAEQEAAASLSPEELEQEAGQEGAFNPETGEINWDCPCLGGMAHGPCGEEFRAAFSCFVFSTEEPKGVDCIEKFKGMQDCFRQHPDVYGAELESYDDDDEELEPETEGRTTAGAQARDMTDEVTQEAASLAGRAKNAVDEKIPELKGQAEDAVNKGKDAVNKGKDAVANKVSESKRQAQSAVEKGKAAVDEKVPELKSRVNSAVDKGRSAVAETQAAIKEKVPALASSARSTLAETGDKIKENLSLDRAKTSKEARSRALAAKKQVDRDTAEPVSESPEAVPKQWHDQTELNSKAQ